MKPKIIIAGYYFVFITAILPSYADKFTSGMVKRGFAVKSIMADNTTVLNEEGTAAALITFTVYSADETMTCLKVYEDIANILKEEKMLVYSIVVTECVDSIFSASNVFLPKKSDPSPPSISPETMRKMN